MKKTTSCYASLLLCLTLAVSGASAAVTSQAVSTVGVQRQRALAHWPAAWHSAADKDPPTPLAPAGAGTQAHLAAPGGRRLLVAVHNDSDVSGAEAGAADSDMPLAASEPLPEAGSPAPAKPEAQPRPSPGSTHDGAAAPPQTEPAADDTRAAEPAANDTSVVPGVTASLPLQPAADDGAAEDAIVDPPAAGPAALSAGAGGVPTLTSKIEELVKIYCFTKHYADW